MPPDSRNPVAPPLSLLLVLEGPPPADTCARLAALQEVLPVAERYVFGHGDPQRLAPAFRRLAATAPGLRVELATRALSQAAALAQAVAAAAAPWVLWLPEWPRPGEVATVSSLWRGHAGAAMAGDLANGSCLFRRDTPLRLRRAWAVLAGRMGLGRAAWRPV